MLCILRWMFNGPVCFACFECDTYWSEYNGNVFRFERIRIKNVDEYISSHFAVRFMCLEANILVRCTRSMLHFCCCHARCSSPFEWNTIEFALCGYTAFPAVCRNAESVIYSHPARSRRHRTSLVVRLSSHAACGNLSSWKRARSKGMRLFVRAEKYDWRSFAGVNASDCRAEWIVDALVGIAMTTFDATFPCARAMRVCLHANMFWGPIMRRQILYTRL